LEIELNDKYNNIAIKSISEGWSGKLIGIGNKDNIQKKCKNIYLINLKNIIKIKKIC
jgi:hypothetical protein